MGKLLIFFLFSFFYFLNDLSYSSTLSDQDYQKIRDSINKTKNLDLIRQLDEMEKERDDKDPKLKKLRKEFNEDSLKAKERLKKELKHKSVYSSLPDLNEYGVNPKENDIFAFIRSHEQNDYLNATTNYGSDPGQQELPVIINKKVMPEIYSPKDYPFFNPVLIFSRDLSLGKRERIKKSVILIKIVLHTDYLRHYFNELYVIDPQYYNDKYFGDSKKPNIHNPIAAHSFILRFNDYVYVEQSSIISHYAAAGYNKVTYNFGGKGFSTYHPYLPISFYHELLHVMGLSHPPAYKEKLMDAKSSSVIDSTRHMSFYPFSMVYYSIKFPKIPYNCYKGLGENWNEC